MRCNGMRSCEFVMRCGWLRCHVVWFEVVVWGELEDDLVIRTTQIYSVLHCTTKYYSGTTLYYTVPLQYYSVLQSTTPVLILYYKVLLQYYSLLQSTTPVLLQYYSVLQSTIPVLLCTTQYYSSTTPYYSSTTLYYIVLLQYYSVLQSTTPVLLCTTKYYSSTTLYYNVLLQYYSVLQSTTPVLLCTTKYYSSTNSVLQSSSPVLLCTAQIYSSTTLYYKVLLQYYSVLQSTTPVLLLVLQRTQNVTNVTKCCACHAKWLSWLILVTYETSFTMRRATGLILQRHQILHLPRKMTFMSDVRHIWNVIYNVRSNRQHPPTSPSTVPATKNDSHHWSSWHMKRHLQCTEQQATPSNLTKCCACHEKWFASLILVTYETSFTMRGATGITLQPHQILLRLPRKALQNLRKICRKQLKRQFQCAADSTMIRTWSEHDPTMKLQNWTRPFAELTFPPSATHFVLKITTFRAPTIYPDFTKYCTCHEKWHSKITKYCASHKKVTLMSDVRHIWNVIYNARSNRTHPPTSPNTAPATQNDSHEWCPSHMKRHLQCAEQQVSSTNVTKY